MGKVEELIESAAPPKASEQETAKEEDGSVELESQVQKDGVADSTVLSSMPCLLMELRRDSSESQLASTESDKPTTGRVYESDSSNHCMLSPSSSGHLADSDTLSSVEENNPRKQKQPWKEILQECLVPLLDESLGGPVLKVKHLLWLPRKTGNPAISRMAESPRLKVIGAKSTRRGSDY